MSQKVFFYIAATGWIVSITVHLLALFDITMPFAMILHIGIFAVWIPLVL